MIKIDLVLESLNSLTAHVAKLEQIRPVSLETWKTDIENYWAVLHGLQIAIQHVIDIGNHILAGQNLAAPADYKDALLELGRNRVIPTEFAEKISGMAGMRNIIAHRYLGVDPQKVFSAIHDDLDDFKVFVDHIYDYLNREGFLPDERQSPGE